ncbi:hypothetical protein [Verrucosispora sp. WMMD573]|uniref:hypothetical protein n=1 Tax=Verrucosispora sp. WMMD573 TaxID=3015149 RepID=UPI00248ACFAA|nr:hypothetical protein [Verrucosispora sp. WMMD573]WBB56622.1 hypothetical protein O7601_11425 [Verrucosispora sp. WMMD573]
MSNEPGGPTAAQPDQSATVDPGTDDQSEATGLDADDQTGAVGNHLDAGRPAPAPATTALALLATGWLAAMLWSTREAISSATAGVTAVSLSAFALPGVISAALVAGAAVGLAAGEPVARRTDRVTLRFAVAIGAGLLVGLLAALAIDLSYAGDVTTRTIAGTTAAAAVIGGALAGARNGAVVGAVAAAALGTLIFVVAFSVARDPLFNLFGAGDNQQSLVNAASWVSRTESLLAGLIAGGLAFGYLIWARRRVVRDGGAAGPRWPAYLVAGAGPGLLLLLSEVIIRIGGRSLIDLAAALSEADAVAQTSLGTSRVDNAIWVLFVGALTAVVSFGRTLGSPTDDEA